MLETKILLEEKGLPPHWYNIAADLPEPLQPPLNPATREPISPEDLTPIFPRGLIEQEVSQEGWVQVPREVLEVLRLWHPTPLYRAHRLEERLCTPARIYYILCAGSNETFGHGQMEMREVCRGAIHRAP